MKFAHLHVHSHYSLLDGLARIDELVNRAAELGMDSLALTDHGNLYGAIEFYQKAKKAGVKPIVGAEIYLACGKMSDRRPGIDDRRYHLTVLAENETGYRNLLKLITRSHLEGFYYKPRADKELLRGLSKGLIALSGCFAGEIPSALKSGNAERAERLVREYQEIFGRENFYLEIMPHFGYADQKKINEGLSLLSAKTGAALVATNDIHYVKPEDGEVQDILLSVQTGNKIGDEDRLTMRQANLSMRSAAEMISLFPDKPEAVAAAGEIAERANLEIEFGKPKLPVFAPPAEYDENYYLDELCLAGAEKKYAVKRDDFLKKEEFRQARERLYYELNVIKRTGFAGYFLVVQDFVRWAKTNGIIVGPGRGSAAGSLASYLLDITTIDPLKYNLLFERFLNPERISMPDIDLDFADTRRDEVIDYVSRKYGKENVAQIITFGTMAARAAIRDAGRALGMPYGFCDQIAKMIPFSPQGEKSGWLKKNLSLVKEFREIYERDPEAKRLIDAAMKLEGVARHASTHACGVVISPRPLEEYVPLQHASKQKNKSSPEQNQAVVTQYDMHAVESLGLMKMDFLGLRNLTIIENAAKLVKNLRGANIDMDGIPLDDQKTFELFRRGETTGLFQFESDGMKRYLKELKPAELEDLIAMVALYRPGPMELIPAYIKRKHGREKITYLHPKLEPILKNTCGIGIYQEQMMQIARDLAGFSLPEADTLRKAIGKKIKRLLEEQREKIISGMLKNGVPPKIAEAIWELFPPFSRYGFNRSHAACYALIAYQTGFLKAHYPTEFMAALLAAEGTETEKTAFFVEEARAMGIEIMPPDVNESFADFTVVGEKKIRFGMASVKNVGANVVEEIIAARKEKGRFVSVADFMERARHRDLNKKSLESLIKCGALDSLGERNQLLAGLDLLLEYHRETRRLRSGGQISLFGLSPETKIAQDLKLPPAAPAEKRQLLAWEKELLGLYVTSHPMQEYAEKLKTNRILPLKNLSPDMNNRSIAVAGLISGIQKTITKSGEPMLFVKMEDLTSRAEVLVFPKVLARNPSLWQEEKVLLVKGRLSDRDGTSKILCEEALEIV